MKILYSSPELHDAIKDVLAEPQPHDRRVALVAFVGGTAQAFLPDPNGLEIVCWLQPGSTDPLTLARLQERGAKIFKSERLHMKVYWSSRCGCVICSANASGKALGGGDQKEAGVWLPSNVVNIERLWTYARPTPITDNDLKRLPPPPPPPGPGPDGSVEPPPDFLEWQNLSGRRDWKLGWWNEDLEFSKGAVEKARQTYGVKEPAKALDTKQGQARKGDWFLQFRLPRCGSVDWQYVDFVVRVPSSDKRAFERDHPFQAVQANRSSRYPRPPFKIDKAFRNAFKKAVKSYGAEQIESIETLRPPKRLLNLIAKNMRTLN